MNIVSFKKNKENKNTDEDIEIPQFTTDEIKENFPSLYKELSGDSSSNVPTKKVKELLLDDSSDDIKLSNEILTEDSDSESESDSEIVSKPMEKDYLQGFDPKAVDFIRRAKTNEEAIEVLDYLEKRGEISMEDCKNLMIQLEKHGLESFGEHKEDGFYFEYQRKKHMEEKMKLSGKQPSNNI